MTFHRLLLREIVVPLLLALVLVSQLLVVLQMLQLNEVLFGSGFEVASLLRIAVYLAPHFAVFALPLAFLLAVMLGIGRLAEDRELVALQALGRSPRSLYPVPIAMGLVLGAAVGLVTFFAEPWGLRGIHRQLNELIKRNVAGDIRPGLFYEDIPRFTVFVGATEAGQWKDVLLHDASGDGAPLLMLARHGRVESEGADSVLQLDLAEGELHRLNETGGYTRARFENGTVALGVADIFHRKNFKFNRRPGEMSAGEMREVIAEAREGGDLKTVRRLESVYHGRFAAVATCLVFGLLAVPLASAGRAARGRSFIATLVAFAGYYVVQTLGVGLGEAGRLPPMAGAWLPNLVGAVAALVLGWRLLRGRPGEARR